MIVAGCDIGSTSGKVVILKDGKIIAHSTIPNELLSDVTAQKTMDEALQGTDFIMNDLNLIIGTGYGRIDIPFAKKSVTEIACHGKGAFWTNNKVRTVIDIGGQDAKVIKVDEHVVVKDFVLNDKCAAGTGKFLENMAKILDIQLEDMGEMSPQSRRYS